MVRSLINKQLEDSNKCLCQEKAAKKEVSARTRKSVRKANIFKFKFNNSNEIGMIDITKAFVTVLNVCQTVYQLALELVVLTFVAVVIIYDINRLLDTNVDFNWQVYQLCAKLFPLI